MLGDALFVTDSKQAMLDHLEETKPELKDKISIRKLRLSNALRSLKQGAAFAFNTEAYKRFYPLGKEFGLPLGEVDFDSVELQKESLFYVRIEKKEK